MQRMRTRAILLGVCTLLLCSMQLNAQGQFASSKPHQSQEVPQGFFIEAGGGYASLPKKLTQLGDSSVSEVPNAYGFAEFAAFGVRPLSWLRVKFEYEHERVSGDGAFAQKSNDPNNVGAHGNFAIGTGSKMGVVEADIWRTHRFTLFIGGGGGKTSVLHYVRAQSDPVTFVDPESNTTATIVMPVVDHGKDRIWDATGRVGVRFRATKNLELSCGAYGKDSVNGKCSAVWFPSSFISSIFKK